MTTPEAGQCVHAWDVNGWCDSCQTDARALVTTQAETLSEVRTKLNESLGRELTQAETIRGLDNVLIIQTETIRQAQETIRRLEGEVARLQVCESFRDEFGRLLERAEAAEGWVRRYGSALESIAKNTCCDHCQEAALVAQKALKPSPATGEGA